VEGWSACRRSARRRGSGSVRAKSVGSTAGRIGGNHKAPIHSPKQLYIGIARNRTDWHYIGKSRGVKRV
jgi:hypothetical protein